MRSKVATPGPRGYGRDSSINDTPGPIWTPAVHVNELWT